MSETFDAALRRGAAELAKAGIENAAGDARALALWAAGIDAARLTAILRDEMPGPTRQAYDEALIRRAGRIPVSHIVGGRLFWGRWFEVTADVLDPRPETEIMIARALELPPPAQALELGVGSGCILGTILAERPDAKGLGIDISPDALKIAQRNLSLLDVTDRSDLRTGDWLRGIDDSFDLVLCNPPYVTAAEMQDLSPEVFGHEPHIALSPGGDGLAPYRAIAPELNRVLAPGGAALFEIGPTQAAEVAEIFASAGWAQPEILKDFDGRDRCLLFSDLAKMVTNN